MQTVTIHLQSCRRDADLTLRELQTLTNCPRSSLHRFEHEQGRLAEALDTLGRISQALNTSPWLIAEYPDWPVPGKACTCVAEKGNKA